MTDLLKFADAASRSACSPDVLRRAAAAGELAVIRLGSSARSDRIRPEDLEAFWTRRRQCQLPAVKMDRGLSPFASTAADIERLIGAGRTRMRGRTSGPSSRKHAPLRVVSNPSAP